MFVSDSPWFLYNAWHVIQSKNEGMGQGMNELANSLIHKDRLAFFSCLEQNERPEAVMSCVISTVNEEREEKDSRSIQSNPPSLP